MTKKNDKPSELSRDELIALTGWDPDAKDDEGKPLERPAADEED